MLQLLRLACKALLDVETLVKKQLVCLKGLESFMQQHINKLKRLRGARGWKIKELERRSGVDATTISALENGRRKARIDTLGLLARAFNIPIDELLEFLDTGARVLGRIRHPQKD